MYLTHLEMIHKKNYDWYIDYFKNPSDRLTAMTQNLLPEGYYERFGEVYSLLSKYIILRAKFSNHIDKKVNVITVWDSEMTYEKFSKLVDGQIWFEAFHKTGINFEFHKKDIHDADLRKILVYCKKQDHIIYQEVAAQYQTIDMIIGDPFKEKNNDHAST